MAVTYTFPVGNNTFVPNSDATDDMIIAFSRNKDEFPFDDYVQIVPVTKRVGNYWRLRNQEASRVPSADGSAYEWADGDDAPTGTDNLEAFGLDFYRTSRFAYTFVLGDLTIEQASWDVLKMQSAVVAQKAMTHRGMNIQSALAAADWGLNVASVDGSHGAVNGNAALLGNGQNFSNGSATTPNIKIAFNKASISIQKATQGVVRPRDVIFVASPDTYRLIGESAEVHEYVRNGPFSHPTLEGSPQLYDEYGVPKIMYGHQMVIDDTVFDSAQKGATANAGYTIPLGTGYFITRKGGIQGSEIARQISTVVMFAYEEFTIETKDDRDNRRTRGRIVSDYQINVTSTLSGYYFQNCVG